MASPYRRCEARPPCVSPRKQEPRRGPEIRTRGVPMTNAAPFWLRASPPDPAPATDIPQNRAPKPRISPLFCEDSHLKPHFCVTAENRGHGRKYVGFGSLKAR